MTKVRKTAKNPKILKDLKAVATWLAEQGYVVSERTVYNHAAEPAFPSKQKGGGYLEKQIETYANATWENPKRAQASAEVKPGTSTAALDAKARILAADAAMREHKLAVAKGLYYLKSAEDQRDALVLYGIKTAVENFGPFMVQDLIALVGSELGAEAAARLGRIVPELGARYRWQTAELFDGMAKRGVTIAPCPKCQSEQNREAQAPQEKETA